MARAERASLKEKPSMTLKQEPVFRCEVNSKRPAGADGRAKFSSRWRRLSRNPLDRRMGRIGGGSMLGQQADRAVDRAKVAWVPSSGSAAWQRVMGMPRA